MEKVFSNMKLSFYGSNAREKVYPSFAQKKNEKVLNVFIIFISYHYTHTNKHNHRENIFLLGKYNSTTQCPEIFKRFAFRIEAITLATLTPARVHFN